MKTELLEEVVQGLLHQKFYICDSFLTPEQAAGLCAYSMQLFEKGALKKAGIGKEDNFRIDSSIRGDFIEWIDKKNIPAPFHFVLDKIQGLADYLNQTCYLGIRNKELHLAVYPVGTAYKRHLDVFAHTLRRKVSVVVYLNEDWREEDGGQLRLFLPQDNGGEKTLDILPVSGRLVCFLSAELEHEVLKAHRTRFSLTGWLTDELVLV